MKQHDHQQATPSEPRIDPLARSLDALGRSLASANATPMPEAITAVIRQRSSRRNAVRAFAGLAAAACLTFVGIAVMNAAKHDENNRSRPGSNAPGSAIATTAHPSTGDGVSLASITAATRGLEGTALLNAIPSPTAGSIGSGTSGDAMPRAGDSPDSPRARGVLRLD